MARFPNEFTVRVLADEMVLHRGCFGRDEASVLESLRSNYEARREPPHPADLHATILHMAVSMFEHSGSLARMARRRPERMGTHIATLRLRPGYAVCVADTGGPGHWSVWGVPAHMLGFVADVRRVQ